MGKKQSKSKSLKIAKELVENQVSVENIQPENTTQTDWLANIEKSETAEDSIDELTETIEAELESDPLAEETVTDETVAEEPEPAKDEITPPVSTELLIDSAKQDASLPVKKTGLLSSFFSKTNSRGAIFVLGALLVVLGAFAFTMFKLSSASPSSALKVIEEKVSIAGIDVSGLAPEAALKKLEDIQSAQKFTVTINGIEHASTASDLGVSRSFKPAVDQAATIKSGLLAGIGLKSKTETNIDLPQTIVDETKLTAYLKSLVTSGETAVDATLNLVNGVLTVTPAQVGLKLDTTPVKTLLTSSTLTTVPKIDLKLTESNPSITTAAAESAKAEAERLLSYDYTFGSPASGNKTLTYGQELNWLIITPQASTGKIDVKFDTNKALADVESTVRSLNRAPVNGVVVNVPGQPSKTVNAGAPGINMPDAEVARAKAEFQSALSTSSKAVVLNPVTTPQSNSIIDGQAKTIYADLSLFTAYAIENGVTVYTAKFTSGKPGHTTPVGTHYMTGRKVPISTMKGCAGGECWSVPNLKWQSYFTEFGHAIHATPSPSYIGVTNISHGCLGMTEADAKFFFDWATTGTPLVIVP
jgi:lipoprotein-anchoring transpeptidase ErfK/SrfK